MVPAPRSKIVQILKEFALFCEVVEVTALTPRPYGLSDRVYMIREI